MRRFLVLLVATLFVLGLASCGDEKPKKGTSGKTKEKAAEDKTAKAASDEPADDPLDDPDDFGDEEQPVNKAQPKTDEAKAAEKGAATSGVLNKDATPPSRTVKKEEPIDLGLESTIVARVNGKDVDAREYFERLARITKKRSGKVTKDMLTKNTVDRLINDQLLEEELTRLNLPVDDKEIADSLGMDMERFDKTKDKMDARVQSERRKLAVSKLLSSKGLLEEPTDEDLRKEFGKRRMIRLNVVNFKVDANATPDDKVASRVKADEFLATVRGGKDFKEAAKDLTDDKLGRRAVRPMIVRDGEERHKVMWDAASTMDENAFGGPVETQFGWAVFQVVKKIEPKYTYEEMKDRLRKTVLSQKAIQGKKKLIEELRKTAKIEYLIEFPAPQRAAEALERPRINKGKLAPTVNADGTPVMPARGALPKIPGELEAPAPAPAVDAPAPEAAPAK